MTRIEKIRNLVLPLPVTLTTCRAKKNDPLTDNIIPLSWVGIVEYRPHMVNITIGKNKYSANIIRDRKEFGLCIATVEMMEIVDKCGYSHGDKVDKFKMSGLKKFNADIIDAPLIEECPICLECKVNESVVLETHEVFVAEVVATHINQKYILKNGEPDIEKMNVLCYADDNYYTLGRKLNPLYYSKK